MPRKPDKKFNEKGLTKGHLRKLNALRKSLGQEIADKAFAEWFEKYGGEKPSPEDKNARRIAEALEPLVKQKKLQVPRGGYIVKRGRGRVIVTRAMSE